MYAYLHYIFMKSNKLHLYKENTTMPWELLGTINFTSYTWYSQINKIIGNR